MEHPSRRKVTLKGYLERQKATPKWSWPSFNMWWVGSHRLGCSEGNSLKRFPPWHAVRLQCEICPNIPQKWMCYIYNTGLRVSGGWGWHHGIQYHQCYVAICCYKELWNKRRRKIKNWVYQQLVLLYFCSEPSTWQEAQSPPAQGEIKDCGVTWTGCS